MLLSIVMPSFNHGRFLPAALDSILAQDHRPLEIIVVDGASKDDTVAVLERYAERHPELRFLSEPDKGPADAVNKGLAMVRGELIGICSADDTYHPGALSKVVRAAQAHPDAGFIYGDVVGIDADGKALGADPLPDFSWEAFFAIGLAIPQGSIFFRTSVQRQVGGWNAAYYGCDLDFWLRILFRTRALHLREPLSSWRMHEQQRTRPDAVARIRRDYARMIEESPEIAAAPARIRRLARASSLLWCFLEPGPNLWPARRDALKALFLHPGYPRYLPRQRLLRLVPGYGRVRGWLTRSEAAPA